MSEKSRNATDNVHVYSQLREKVNCRYVRIKNREVPGGNFALSGLRVFGKGNGKIPNVLENFTVKRNQDDKRSVHLNWKRSTGATGYNICYGTNKNKLYQHYTVYSDTSLEINSLNVNQAYYFAIDGFNENGISQKSPVVIGD